MAAELDAAFETLRNQPDLKPWIAPRREFVNPAEWTARELFREMALAHLRRAGKAVTTKDQGVASNPMFFISLAHDACPGVKLAAPGVLDADYKITNTIAAPGTSRWRTP